jgi:large subunit ribosomal protein L29
MKGVRASDLRGNDPAELRSTVRKLEEDLFKHRLKKNTNQLENTMLIRNTRRDIARVNTVLAERLRGAPAQTAPAAGKSEAPAAKQDAQDAKAAKAKRAPKKQTKEQET